MGELLSLRTYGRAVSRSDGPSFRVSWSEDSNTIVWDDGRMHLNQFRELGLSALRETKASLDRLLYGLQPNIELDRVLDRLSNTAQGYSFVSDAANNFSTAYLELSDLACLDSVDGLMSSERWNFQAVCRYLKEETTLLANLMLLMHFRGGQAPRSTEFFSIECWNGASTARGLYVHEGRMMYVTRHSKARRTTNQEFQVARYLPLEDSRLFATYLVYVRPFAEMLHRVCYGRVQERRLLFSSSESPDVPWKVEVLTKALKGVAKEACGIAFGVQIYRQLSIAMTEKHVKPISRPFNRYADKDQEADAEVAFAWQSGHRPIRRGTSYGIDSAYPDSLQPALLRVYRWVSDEWQRFLGAEDIIAPPSQESASVPESPPREETDTAERSIIALSPLTEELGRKRWNSMISGRATRDVSRKKLRRTEDHSVPAKKIDADVQFMKEILGTEPTLKETSIKPLSKIDKQNHIRRRGIDITVDQGISDEAGFNEEAAPNSLDSSTREGDEARHGKYTLDGLETALNWWQGKCPYCVGRKYRAFDCLHPIRSCKKGGARQDRSTLGELIYKEGMRVERGCPDCALPTFICRTKKSTVESEKEEKKKRGSEQERADVKCHYDGIVYDVVIGLYQSGNEIFYQDLYESAMDWGVESLDNEEIVSFLISPLSGAEREACEIIKIFLMWTKQVRRRWNF